MVNIKNKLYLIIILLFVLGLFYGESTKNKSVVNNSQYINIALPTVILSPTPLPEYCLFVPVLLYHHVQPQAMAKNLGQEALSVDDKIFDQQIGYLVSQGYTGITAKQLVDALKRKSSLPAKSIVLTFDDGYKDHYDFVYPILKKYRIVGNLMIAGGLIGSFGYLTWDQVEEMGRSGLVSFTNHTWSHYPITNGSLEKIKFEIQTGRQQLEEHIKESIDMFTYPYGSFDDASIKTLKREGVVGAFSTIPGFSQCDSFVMSLHRNRIGNFPLAEYGL